MSVTPGSRMMQCSYFRFPDDEEYTIAGVTHCVIVPEAVAREDPGSAADPGPVNTLVTRENLKIQVFGVDALALIALVGMRTAVTGAPLTGIIGYRNAEGGDETLTVLNLYFNRHMSPVELPARDSGGKLPVYGIEGSCEFGLCADDVSQSILGTAGTEGSALLTAEEA